MRVVNIGILTSYADQHADCKTAIGMLITVFKDVDWRTPHELKRQYPKASIVGDGKVVFNICGNKYRVLVKISYQESIIFIKKVGNHQEYNKWEIN